MKIDFREKRKDVISIDDLHEGYIIVAYDPEGNTVGNLRPLVLTKVDDKENPYVFADMNITSVHGHTIKDAILTLRKLHPEYNFEVY